MLVTKRRGPPVLIPNTEVKLSSSDNTCLATNRKDSPLQAPLKKPERAFFFFLTMCCNLCKMHIKNSPVGLFLFAKLFLFSRCCFFSRCFCFCFCWHRYILLLINLLSFLLEAYYYVSLKYILFTDIVKRF